LINYCYDPLQNWCVVFGVWIDHTFQIGIGLGFVHLMLNVHDLLEYRKDIGLGIFYAVEQDVCSFIPK